MKTIYKIITIFLLFSIMLATIPTQIFATETETFDKENLLVASNISKE